jgi:cytosine/adenosine deaminase-related metal-dependent hydrolase
MLDAPTLRAAARYYIQDALLHGTSSLIDHHESPACIEGSLDVLADACQELGLRAVLCYGATERNRGRAEGEAGLAECRRFLRENERPLVRGVVGLHASFTVGDDTLREAAELCREFDTVLHVHLAEDLADVEDARARGWPGPLERLLAFDCLPAGSILAHGVHLDAEQVAECARRGLWLVQNPRSNANNRVGHPRFFGTDSLVALGTDGFPSSMPDEEAALFALPPQPTETEASRALRLSSGHRLIAERFGAEADRDDHARYEGSRCTELVVAGERVIGDAGLCRADAGAIVQEARTAAARLWSRMNELP